MTLTYTIFLGALQGITELFPISSLGHSVLLPHLFGWNIDEGGDLFLVFLVATHLATALVLLGFYWKEWVKIITGVLKSIFGKKTETQDVHTKIGWLLIVATIPAGLIGLFFEKKLRLFFNSAEMISVFLLLNGVMLLIIEKFNTKNGPELSEEPNNEKIASLNYFQAIKVGLTQCLALFPGFSRTGSSLGGGLLAGLNHVDSAKFSFMLATPIIFAASILKIPELFHVNDPEIIKSVLIGALCSGITAYISVRFLEKYFKTKTLKPFGFYCILLGAISLILILV